MTMRSQNITVSGRKVRLWRGGTGPALLLLHAGWGDAEFSWSAVWEELGRSFTVIAPDLPGFGASAPLERPTAPGMAALAAGTIAAQGIDRVVVAGNSFGGSVALRFAADYPERTSSLFLVNGGYTPSLPGLIRKAASAPPFNDWLRRLVRRAAFSPQALEKAFVRPGGLPAGFLDAILMNAVRYSALTFETFMNTTGRPVGCARPTFIVWGAGDRLSPIGQARRLQKSMPGSLIIALDDAGHMPQLEQPGKFAMALTRAASACLRS